MERELRGNQNPQVRLGYSGGVVSNNETTWVSPMGALIQMFDPFSRSEAKQLMHGVYAASQPDIVKRAAGVLGLTDEEYLRFIRYLYDDAMSFQFATIVKTLRTLK